MFLEQISYATSDADTDFLGVCKIRGAQISMLSRRSARSEDLNERPVDEPALLFEPIDVAEGAVDTVDTCVGGACVLVGGGEVEETMRKMKRCWI